MGFAQECSKYYKLSLQNKFRKNEWLHFSINSKNLSLAKTFWGQNTTSYGSLTPCQNLKKINDPIPKKMSRKDRWRNGWMNGRTDRPFLIGPFQLSVGDPIMHCNTLKIFEIGMVSIITNTGCVNNWKSYANKVNLKWALAHKCKLLTNSKKEY